ncbi:E3 ubiquitin-protein ligase DTX3L-like [Carassius auratus]|uniref:E3 ubiquitin-protein ligase n=1 Tax=Carassius auratus TaxID=7957 RepID=A0A6P6MJC4_CARAU|nr:E3 ubiquitin-protein ligase DTX3L-like [Carassius auratus]XP_026096563.1 E3 ubiquitin-protein ligase DTX3L-like [Carassius auratus]
MDMDEYDLYTSGAEGQDAGPSLDYMMHLNMIMNQPHLPEEDIYTARDEKPRPSAPLDIAKFKIKVDWIEPFPERWRARLQIALQSWLSRLEGKPSVHNVKLMEDPSCAEVQITPSTALKVLKYHRTVSLKFKDYKDGKDKEVTAQIYLDEAHSVCLPQKSLLEENKAPSSKVNSTKPVTSAVSEDTNTSDDVVAATRASNDAEIRKSFKMTHETLAGISLPVYQFWYLHHAYRKELELIEKQHGVSMHAEVSVSFKSTQRSSSDSVSIASEDFQKLLSECVESFSQASINHKYMDSVIVKEALHYIQSEKTKMMFTMSASDCRFFGPKQFTDIIKRETTRSEHQFKNKSNELDVDNICPQSRSSLVMDTKDFPTQLEMDKVHWDLIKLSYKEQLLQLETKYGVLFHEEKLQKNVIKVHARSKGDQHINLESHALRALTHLYQKLASAAVSCELTKPTDQTAVAPIVEKLQQQNYCVVAANEFSPWKLVGLPEHLGPAIADIEKKLQKHVFDDKKKKLIGYSGDIPHARGIRWNRTPEYGPGAVGGAAGDQTDSRFNKESEINARHKSKGAHAEEEMCPICMDSFTDQKKLKCGHEFCRECIRMSVESLGPICPVCNEFFGKMEGNQPDGTMKVMKNRLSLPGYPNCGTIQIHYNIPSGIQMKRHPNPGQYFHGARCQAYLPDNREGRKVLSLLQRAFDQKLIFTVGTSTTSGLKNVVTWNDIHHKNNTHGGPLNYGYPDPDYLRRVKDELKAKGIE